VKFREQEQVKSPTVQLVRSGSVTQRLLSIQFFSNGGTQRLQCTLMSQMWKNVNTTYRLIASENFIESWLQI
jgi:hypothetical protein